MKRIFVLGSDEQLTDHQRLELARLLSQEIRGTGGKNEVTLAGLIDADLENARMAAGVWFVGRFVIPNRQTSSRVLNETARKSSVLIACPKRARDHGPRKSLVWRAVRQCQKLDLVVHIVYPEPRG